MGVSEAEIIKIAVRSLGLDELGPFDPQKKIIEYRLRDTKAQRLIGMTLSHFAEETASESPAPGGGSIAAYAGALGAALGTMVANLSSHKKGWDGRWEEFSQYAEKGQAFMSELLALVDEDTNAFNKIMQAFGLPKSNDAEKIVRATAIETATIYAIKIPFRTMELAYEAFDLTKRMAEIGNPNSVSDAGVGALCLRTAIKGAYMNVRINSQGLENNAEIKPILDRAEIINTAIDAKEKEVWEIVLGKMK